MNTLNNSNALKIEELELQEKIDRITKHKLVAEEAKVGARLYDHVKGSRIENCGSYLILNVYQHIQQAELRMKTLKNANFCKFKFCPLCQWRKARQVCNEVLAKLQTVYNNRNGVEFLFLTLTLKNVPLTDLKGTLKLMSASFKRMSETQKYKNAVIGSVRAIEFVGDKTVQGECHPHYHCLLVVNKSYFKKKDYIKQAEWTDMWQQALRVEYKPIVNVQKIKPKGNLTALQASALEVIKYSVTSADLNRMTDEDFNELVRQTKGVRQYNLGGEVRTAEPTPTEEFDIEQWTLIGEEIYKWSNSQYNLLPPEK